MNKVIDIIIEFINAANPENSSKGKRLECQDENNNVFAINGAYYLLAQIIRQYSINWDHYFISKKAKEKWESITDEKMNNFWYRNKVVFKKDHPVTLNKYKGNSKNFETCVLKEKGDSFLYREVFHDEHMITISDIITELFQLEVVNEENVKKVLNKIYVCRMLKDEDRALSPKNHRSTDLNEVIQEVYNKCGIELVKDYFS